MTVQAADNPDFEDWTESFAEEDNLAFFETVLETFRNAGFGHGGLAVIGLVGHADRAGGVLRRAQGEHLRWDRRPSLWSHAFLLVDSIADVARPAQVGVREVVLHSRAGAIPDPGYRGVTEAALGHYASPLLDPNVALLAVDMDAAEARAIAARATQRESIVSERFDLWELLVHWQSFYWSRDAPNPLAREVPMFCSALIDYCFEEIGLDLRRSGVVGCPESLWNSARWWNAELQGLGRRIRGCHVVRDPRCALLDPATLEQERAFLRI